MTQPTPDPAVPTFELDTVGVKAQGRPNEQGKFVVLAGSQARAKVTDSYAEYVPSGYQQKRQELLDGGLLVPNTPETLVLQQDTEFRGSTEAAVVLLGRNTDGTQEWRRLLPDGNIQTHGQWLAQQSSQSGQATALIEAVEATWPPFFREMAQKVLEYENRQPELLQLLRTSGVHVQHDEGEELAVLDPFSFFSLILKHQAEASVFPILARIKDRLNLQAPVPTDLNGVPWSNPMNAWFFAYRSKRKPEDVPTLWALARQALAGELNADTFEAALNIHKVALPKLTQGLFWLNPERFLALNGVTIPYLESRGIKASKVSTLAEYHEVLRFAQTVAPNFPTLSHLAWQSNEYSKKEATLIDGHFPFAQFRQDAQHYTDDHVKGNMVLDRKYAPLLLELLSGPSLSALQPSRSPYSGKSQLTVKVSLGGGVKMDGASFGRALLMPEDGFEYVPLPQGLTLEVGLPDGKGDGARERLNEPAIRTQLLDALFAPVLTSQPPNLTLNSDFGMVGLQPLTITERSNAEALLDSYIGGIGKSRRLRIGLSLTPAELEGEHFAEVLESGVAYVDRLVALFDTLVPQDLPTPETKVIQPIQPETPPVISNAFVPVPGVPLNQILYGPPGTGKTYRVVDRALAVLDPYFLEGKPTRAERKARYDELVAQGQITFVTFHQNFGYEDFVEGIKPVMQGNNLSYELEDGLFLQAVQAASGKKGPDDIGSSVNPHGQVWRIYIDGTVPVSEVRRRSLERGEVRVGSWLAGTLTLDGRPAISRTVPENLNLLPEDQLNAQQLTFRDSIRLGDLVVLATGADQIGGVGIVTSDYFFDTSETLFTSDYAHARQVHWLATTMRVSAQSVLGKSFSPQTIQRVAGITPAQLLEKLHLSPPGQSGEGGRPLPHVLIIDEINRGNVAKVFGELITLLEPSKRAGAAEALSVRLPLSKRLLSVPQSLYVIGTMNTADRSLTLLDAALRRRFVFEPVWPEPEVLPVLAFDQGALDLQQFLRAINTRIEKLLSREQVIGHAYLLDIPQTLEGVGQALQQRILPLLEEYFFEDWGQIRQVLGDDQKPTKQQFIREVQDGDIKRYERNKAAFDSIEAYVRTYSGTREAGEEE